MLTDGLNLPPENIKMIADPTKKQMNQLNEEIKAECKANKSNNLHYTYYIYFTGMGVQCQTSYMFLNEENN